MGFGLNWMLWMVSREDYVVGAPCGENSSFIWFAFGTWLSIFAHSAKCCNCFDHCAHFLYYSTIKLMTPKTRVFKWKLAEAPPAAKQIKVNYLPHCCRRDHYYYFLLNRCESCLANCCGSSFVATLHVGQKEVKLDILECWIAPG